MAVTSVCDFTTLLGIDPGFTGPKAYIVGCILFKKQDYEITNTKLGTKVMISNVKVFTTNTTNTNNPEK